jgi:methionyl aminopeptidase
MIIIKTKDEIEKMRKGGRILAWIMRELQREVKKGVSTEKLNEIAEKLVKEKGAEPSFKNYRHYPSSLCTSVNDRVVHAIPREDEILKNGDIISLDLGIKYLDYYTDMAVTLPVEKVSQKAKKLLAVTQKAMGKALEWVKPGNFIGDISYAIQKYVEGEGFSVVRDLVGHGLGKEVHEEPRIPNYGVPKTGPILEEGMTIAIEPMVTVGGWEVETLDDGWSVKTKDGSLSAHFEQTILVTKRGYEILTK